MGQSRLDQGDLQRLLSKGEEGTAGEAGPSGAAGEDVDRVQGLGFTAGTRWAGRGGWDVVHAVLRQNQIEG